MTNIDDSFYAEFELYSPRWGHPDPYNIRITSSELSIEGHNPKLAKCVLADDGEFVWSGHNCHYENSQNPLIN
jgi:Integron cassette protein